MFHFQIRFNANQEQTIKNVLESLTIKQFLHVRGHKHFIFMMFTMFISAIFQVFKHCRHWNLPGFLKFRKLKWYGHRMQMIMPYICIELIWWCNLLQQLLVDARSVSVGYYQMADRSHNSYIFIDISIKISHSAYNNEHTFRFNLMTKAICKSTHTQALYFDWCSDFKWKRLKMENSK